MSVHQKTGMPTNRNAEESVPSIFASSKTQILPYDNKLNAAHRAAMPGDQDLITDTGLAFAVAAGSGNGAGIV